MALDLEMLLNPDEDYSTPQTRQALADALRKKQHYGAIGQLMGVAPTAQVGAGLQDQAQGSLKSALAKQQAAKEAMARAEERKQAQANWQAQMERDQARDAEQRRQFAAQESRLAAGQTSDAKAQWQPIADPITGEIIRVNKYTGEIMREGGQPQQPSAGGGMPSQQGGPISVPPYSPRVGKPPSESESKSGVRGAVTSSALGSAQDIINRDPSTAKPGVFETAGTLFGLSPESQQLLTQATGGANRGVVRSAMEGAVDAALTEMTGAAYTPSQLATYRARFMPTILDSAATRQAKAQQMVEFVRQQSVGAGRAWTQERENQLQQTIAMMNQGFSDQGRVNAPAQQPAQQGPRPGDKYLGGG